LKVRGCNTVEPIGDISPKSWRYSYDGSKLL